MKRSLSLPVFALFFFLRSTNLFAQDTTRERNRGIGTKVFLVSGAVTLAATALPNWRPDPERFSPRSYQTLEHLYFGIVLQGFTQAIFGVRNMDIFLGVNSFSLLYETRDALVGQERVRGFGFGMADHFAYTQGQIISFVLFPRRINERIRGDSTTFTTWGFANFLGTVPQGGLGERTVSRFSCAESNREKEGDRFGWRLTLGFCANASTENGNTFFRNSVEVGNYLVIFRGRSFIFRVGGSAGFALGMNFNGPLTQEPAGVYRTDFFIRPGGQIIFMPGRIGLGLDLSYVKGGLIKEPRIGLFMRWNN